MSCSVRDSAVKQCQPRTNAGLVVDATAVSTSGEATRLPMETAAAARMSGSGLAKVPLSTVARLSADGSQLRSVTGAPLMKHVASR